MTTKSTMTGCAVLLSALAMIAGCGTMTPPADLVHVRNQMKDQRTLERAQQAATETFAEAVELQKRAEKTCADNDRAECEHLATMARYKLATAIEQLGRQDARQRHAAAKGRTSAARREIAAQSHRRRDAERQAARMERIANLQRKVADATDDAEARRAQAMMEKEQALLVARQKQEELLRSRQAYAAQKATLDRLLERDALFNDAGSIVGTDNVKRVRRGIVLTVRDLFRPGETTVRDDRQDLISRIARLATEYPRYSLVVEGHTDSRGAGPANLAISQARAQDVLNRMLAEQVPVGRVTAAGYGEKKAIADNATRQGRAMNRRIDVVFLF